LHLPPDLPPPDRPPPSTPPISIDHRQVHLQTRSITASKCISELHDHSLQVHLHQQKSFPSGRTGCVRVDALRQSGPRHPGGGSLRARRQYHASSCISPSDRRFFSFCRPPTLNKHSGVVANCNHTSEWVHCVHACIGIAMHMDPRNCADPRNLKKCE
jgi:hypothetical protein